MRETTRIWNAIPSSEQTKVANKQSASKMLGGPRLQRIVVSVTPDSQFSAASQSLTPNSHISVFNSQIKFSTQISQLPIPKFPSLNSQHPTLYSQFPISQNSLLNFQFSPPTPNPRFSVPNAQQVTLNSQLPIPNSQSPISQSRFLIPKSPLSTPKPQLPVPDSQFSVSNSQLLTAGSQSPSTNPCS